MARPLIENPSQQARFLRRLLHQLYPLAALTTDWTLGSFRQKTLVTKNGTPLFPSSLRTIYIKKLKLNSEELLSVRQLSSLPWCVGGDFIDDSNCP